MASTWNDDIPIKVYELAKSGMSENQIIEHIRTTHTTFVGWKKKKPILLKALQKGKELSRKKDNGELLSFADYVYQHLPQHLQNLWDKLDQIDKTNSGIEQIELLLENQGQRVRQYLFIHAWIASNFSISNALRKVGVSFRAFQDWKENDPDFAELVKQIFWHRKNFVEDSLFDLIATGDKDAIIFANKTLNRDRGYTDKIDINMNVTGEVVHAVVKVDELELPLETRKEILKSIRKTKEVQSRTIENGK